ncbi:MAG: putative oxidoreductase [Myxococcaceae bacterium]|jgi:2,4-dienoyl-CoA reductase-like NADH-dependent reductase (Old Yellow Enzyme family)|nr:putative oxidoreductase [Myxococcaceae bacterium]
MTLFAPLAIRSMTLPNRVVLPAMVTRLSGEDGVVNDDIRVRYTRFAKGGTGLIVVEAMAVHSAKSGPLLRISSDEFLPGLSDLARSCHDAGPGRVVPQIIHFLKIARSGWRQTIDMLSLEEIDAIVDAYGHAAIRARTAGFDGVELHMAHAYTLSSFLSRLNPRKDAYGGTLENRLRLPLRVLARVRESVGQDFPIGIRFLGEECIRNGYTVVDAGPIAVRLARAGADYISLSAGGKFEDARVIEGEPLYPYTGYSGDRCMPGASYPDGANLYIPDAVRRDVRNAGLTTPIVAVGKIGSLALAESVLARGQGDLVGMARALLADPDLPRKWQAGREDTVVRCVYGNVCKALDENFRRVDCTLWPKKLGQAPDSSDTVPPAWSPAGSALSAEYKEGRVLLRWQAATDNEAVYGYQVFRASGEGGILLHHASARAASTRYEDARVVGGETYRYAVRPYDLAGNRGPVSPTVHVSIPD